MTQFEVPPQAPPMAAANPETALRDRAIERLKKKRDFFTHLFVYATVNSFLVLIWAITSRDAFFWPVFPMAAWGIGLIMNAWDVWRGDFTEDDINREVERLQHHR
jgi:hypothetical protein